MGATVHLPLSEIQEALERARSGESVVLDGDGEVFYLRHSTQPTARPWSPADLGPIHIERTDFRPLAVILADPNKKWSDAKLDDQWERDMEAIRAEDLSNDRDPWAA